MMKSVYLWRSGVFSYAHTMRFHRILIILLILAAPQAWAQYSNDWVVQGQQYLKISIAEDGIYRVTYDDLSQAGLSMAAIDPRLIQLFHRGEEQAILFQHNQTPANAQFD